MLIVDPPTAEVGAVYDGRVVNITKFGAFISILPGRDGLVHISKLGGGKRIDRVEDVLELGQEIQVIVEDVDPNGKISLKPAGDAPSKPAPAAPTAPVVDSEDDAPVADSDDSDDAASDEVASDGDGYDESGSDEADYDDDDDDDDPVVASDSPVQANFEDAFKAELEAVHGDLGNAVSGNRSGGGGGGGGRRRRSR
jgi:polyribonucleotide nucleotidyltransferase